MSPLGFKARVGSLIRPWWRHTCYSRKYLVCAVMLRASHSFSDTIFSVVYGSHLKDVALILQRNDHCAVAFRKAHWRMFGSLTLGPANKGLLGKHLSCGYYTCFIGEGCLKDKVMSPFLRTKHFSNSCDSWKF